MSALIKNFLKNQLLAGSLIFFLGNSLASFGNYLFHLAMGRMLGPADYGVLVSLISLSSLFGIPLSSLSVVVVKYVSAFKGRGELGAIGYLYSWLNSKVISLGLISSCLLIFFSFWIAAFLHLNSVLLVIFVILLNLIGVYQTVPGAILQGLLRFGLLSSLGIVQVILKLSLAVLLVYWGGRVFGALGAILATSLVGYLLTVFFVRRLLVSAKPKEERGMIKIKEIASYALPVFFSTLAFISLYTTDIVLARHFLSTREAGFYAALSTLGKIIFFASGPIIGVMFPLVSAHQAKGKKYLGLLGLSFSLVLLICLGISGIYFFLPSLMVKFLFGKEYLAAAVYLYLFAPFLSLYSLCSLLVSFYLSVGKVRVVILPVTAALAQAVFIFLFHQSITQIVWVSISSLSLLLVSLLVYFFLSYGRPKTALAFRDCSRL